MSTVTAAATTTTVHSDQPQVSISPAPVQNTEAQQYNASVSASGSASHSHSHSPVSSSGSVSPTGSGSDLPASADFSSVDSETAQEHGQLPHNASRSQKKIHFRRAHKKSHLGCANCKKRRIKCDEKLPVCGHCVKSKAQCSYLTAPPEKLIIEKMRQSNDQQPGGASFAVAGTDAHHSAAGAPGPVGPSSGLTGHNGINETDRRHLDRPPPQMLPQPSFGYIHHHPTPPPPPPHHVQQQQPLNHHLMQQLGPSRDSASADLAGRQYFYGYPPQGHPSGPPPPPLVAAPNGYGHPVYAPYQSLPSPSSLQHFQHNSHGQYGGHLPLPRLTAAPSAAIPPPQAHRPNVSQRPFNSQASYGLPPIQPILNSSNSPTASQQPSPTALPSLLTAPTIPASSATSAPSAPSAPYQVPSSDASASNTSLSAITSSLTSSTANQESDLTSHTNESSSVFSSVSTRSSESNSLVRQGFETDMMRSVYCEWISSIFSLACESPSLYHALMSLSYGILSVKLGADTNSVNSNLFTRESTKHRFVALQGIQEQLQREPGDNKPLANSPESLLSSALMLSWDVFFQQDDIRSYVTLCKGFVAVLEKALSSQANNPDPAAVCMKDSVFQGIRCILVPAYNREILEEAVEVLEGLKTYFYEAPHKGDVLRKEFDELVAFLRNVSCYLLTSTRISDSNGLEYYPPSYLFSLLRRWIIMFPSAALGMGSINKANTMTEQELVFYTYYHCFTRLLDALFPEVRYLFQFGFIGPVDLVGVENVLKTISVELPEKLITYPKTVVSFFIERSFHYNRLVGLRNPFKMSNKSLFVETQVKSFKNTTIGVEHFPRLSEEFESKDFDTDMSEDVEDAEAQIFQYYFADRLKVLASIN